MLSHKENYFNFLTLKCLSKFCMLPFDFNGKTGKIQICHSRFKTTAWWMYFYGYVLCCLYTIFTFSRIAIDFVELGSFNFNHFSVHSTWMAAFIVNTYLAKKYKECSGAISTVWNELHCETPGPGSARSRNGPDTDTETGTGTGHGIFQKSRQELLLMFLPQLLYGSSIFFLVILLQDDTRPQLLFQALSESYKTDVNYWICGFLECIVVIFGMTSLYFTTHLHLSLFEHCNDKLPSAIKTLMELGAHGRGSQSPTPAIFVKAYLHSRHIQLLIHLFNQSSSEALFSIKVFLITLSVSDTFLAIHFFSRAPLVGAFNALVGFDCIIVFSLLYERAFQIPCQIGLYKRSILLSSRKLDWKMDFTRGKITHGSELRFKLWIARATRSIPNIGIKVGQFHTMERMSTLIFMDFVTSKVASLLVTFR